MYPFLTSVLTPTLYDILLPLPSTSNSATVEWGPSAARSERDWMSIWLTVLQAQFTRAIRWIAADGGNFEDTLQMSKLMEVYDFHKCIKIIMYFCVYYYCIFQNERFMFAVKNDYKFIMFWDKTHVAITLFNKMLCAIISEKYCSKLVNHPVEFEVSFIISTQLHVYFYRHPAMTSQSLDIAVLKLWYRDAKGIQYQKNFLLVL